MTRVLLVLTTLLLGAPAAAHDRTTSYSAWEVRGRTAHVAVRLSAFDASAIDEGALGEYLTGHLRLTASDAPCAVADGPRRLSTLAGIVAYEWSVECPPKGTLALRSDLLVDGAPAHLHFVRLVRDGRPAEERVLSAGERTWVLAADAPGTSFADWLAIGVGHILGGADHLAFLLALLLIGGSVGEVARVVTGFTAAHSLTLALAVLGWLRPERAAIEALIGLSIALVAAENVWLVGGRGRGVPVGLSFGMGGLALVAGMGGGRVPTLTLAGLALFAICYFALLERVARPAALRWGVAFLFGLVHGFGFAGILAEAHLEPARLARALVGFNLGVEAGQLAVVTLLWPVLRLTTRRHPVLVEVGSAAMAGLGVFWFVSRAY